jgi:hypothetical protein
LAALWPSPATVTERRLMFRTSARPSLARGFTGAEGKAPIPIRSDPGRSECPGKCRRDCLGSSAVKSSAYAMAAISLAVAGCVGAVRCRIDSY